MKWMISLKTLSTKQIVSKGNKYALVCRFLFLNFFTPNFLDLPTVKTNSKKQKLFMISKFPVSIVLIMLFMLTSNYSFSQFHYFYKGGSENEVTGFKYNDNYYDASPAGLKKFINEVEMADGVKADLTAQAKNISRNDLIATISLYGGFGVGAAIVINEGLNKKEGEHMKASTAFTGLGIAALGGIINWIVNPKRKDYYNFVNTFNNGKNQEKIKFGLKIDYDKQMNYGLVIAF